MKRKEELRQTRRGSKYGEVYAALRKLDDSGYEGIWIELKSDDPVAEKQGLRYAIRSWCRRNNRAYKSVEIRDEGTNYLQVVLRARSIVDVPGRRERHG